MWNLITPTMKNIFDPIYRQHYFKGYSSGLNPSAKCKMNNVAPAFLEGFNLGREDYEMMNGCISDGIPDLIVTDKVLEDFLLAGMLGMSIDAEGYTEHQVSVIQIWYQSGVEKYDADQSIYLLAILEKKGIDIN